MTRLLGFGLLVVSVAATLGLGGGRRSPGANEAGGSGQDEAAIRQLADQYAAGWNQGDAKRAAAIFADQAVYVGDDGREIKGRKAIEQNLQQVIGGTFRGTSLTATVDGVQFLSPNVAVAYGSTDVESAPTSRPKGHYVVTCEKSGSAWKVVALGTGLDVTH